MVRAEFVEFDQGMIVGSFCRLSGIALLPYQSRVERIPNDQRLINSEPPTSIRFQKHLGVYTNATVTCREQYGRIQGRRTRLLPRSFFDFMRNLNSSPRGQRDECLKFQEYVARSYELRHKIAARVGVRHTDALRLRWPANTIRWANHLAKLWKSLSVRNVNRPKVSGPERPTIG